MFSNSGYHLGCPIMRSSISSDQGYIVMAMSQMNCQAKPTGPSMCKQGLSQQGHQIWIRTSCISTSAEDTAISTKETRYRVQHPGDLKSNKQCKGKNKPANPVIVIEWRCRHIKLNNLLPYFVNHSDNYRHYEAVINSLYSLAPPK